jgi:hypothetical protein
MTDRPVISTTALAVELCGSEQHGGQPHFPQLTRVRSDSDGEGTDPNSTAGCSPAANAI